MVFPVTQYAINATATYREIGDCKAMEMIAQQDERTTAFGEEQCPRISLRSGVLPSSDCSQRGFRSVENA